MSVIEEINEERLRQQQVEGWTIEHDADHNDGSLVQASVAYCLEEFDFWPWGQESYKLKDKRRNLIRAAALLVAEIERMDRANET